MQFDAQKVWANARQASTEDLLNRVTVFREGMEPQALDIFQAELQARGITREAITAHERAQAEMCLLSADGIARECSFCHNPAVVEGWGWQRLWGRVPVFPRRFRYCREHRPPWLEGSGEH